MAEPLARLHAAIDEVLAVDALALSDDAKLAALTELERAARRLPAGRHPLVAEIDACGVAETRQVRSTATLLRDLLRLSSGEAAMWVKQASEQVGQRDLTSGAPLPPKRAAVAAAVREGALSGEQTQVITKAMRLVPAAIAADRRDALESDLVQHAQTLDPALLSQVCQHALRCLDPDGKKPNETEREARVGLVFGKTRLNGLTPFKGIADAETKAALHAALAPLARPCPSESGPDPRSSATRMVHALRDLALRALAHGDLPSMAGLPATLLLTATLEQLEARTGMVSVLNGGTVPVEDVIRMAAQMRVVPIVFSSAGQTLYCGQAERLSTVAIRYATAAQDRGCVIPGCSVPIQLCQHHHFVDFAKGGETSVENTGWVCPFHHRRIAGWVLERRGGRVWCTAPPWIDPTGTPKLNTYFYPPDLLGDEDHRAAANGRSSTQHHNARASRDAGESRSRFEPLPTSPDVQSSTDSELPLDSFSPHF